VDIGKRAEERKVNAGTYRYGFDGMEKDNEVAGTGNSIDFGERSYDPRLGRWKSTDPYEIKYPGVSPYNFALNNPLLFVDPDGAEFKPSELIAEYGIEMPPLVAGLIDGAFEASPLGLATFAWDMYWDEDFRNTVIEGVKALAADPVGTLYTAFAADMDALGSVIDGTATEEQSYAAGKFISGKVGGAITGGGAMSFFKSLTKRNGEVK